MQYTCDLSVAETVRPRTAGRGTGELAKRPAPSPFLLVAKAARKPLNKIQGVKCSPEICSVFLPSRARRPPEQKLGENLFRGILTRPLPYRLPPVR